MIGFTTSYTGCRLITIKNSKWVWSGNIIITNHRQPCGTARKSRSSITRHQDHKLSKATSSLLPTKTRTDTKQRVTKHRTITDSHNGSYNKQKVNNNRTTALERTAAYATGGLNAFYWYRIFALVSAVVEVQEMFSSHGGHITNAMYHHGETL